MKHIWSVICRHHIVDEKSNNVSLIDITDQISFEGTLPDTRPYEILLPTTYYFISTWISEMGDVSKDYDVTVKIIDPTGAEIGSFNTEFVMTPPDGSRTVGAMKTLLYTVDGMYWLNMFLPSEDDSTPVAQIPIEIVHKEPASDQESEPTE